MSKPKQQSSLRDVLENNQRQRPGGKCRVMVILNEMSAEDKDVLMQALADRDNFSSAGITRALNDVGHHVTQASIQRHRNRDCRCD